MVKRAALSCLIHTRATNWWPLKVLGNGRSRLGPQPMTLYKSPRESSSVGKRTTFVIVVDLEFCFFGDVRHVFSDMGHDHIGYME